MHHPNSIWTSTAILLSLVAIGGGVTLGLVFAAAAWASRESDLAALEHQRQLVDVRLHGQLAEVADELALIAEGYAEAIGDAAVEGEFDLFEGEKFTRIVTGIFKYDEAFVVRANGELVFSADDDLAARYAWVKPLLLPMLASAPRLPAAETDADAKPVTTELKRLQGRPSIAGVVPIPTQIGAAPQPDPIFLIAYRYLDGPALDDLSQEQGLSGARYARSADPDPDEVIFEIEETATREPMGFIVWTPDLPGSKVVVGLIPALGAAAAIVAVLMGCLVLLLRKSWADLRSSEQKAQHRSLHDILTDLPNRGLFASRLESHLEGGEKGPAATVALIDLDRFKAVNDTFGHAAGDAVIQAVGQRIRALLKDQDLLARLGGDEFALLLQDDQNRAGSALALCNRIVAEINRPFSILEGRAVARIGCSIGLTHIHSSFSSVSDVLHAADLALYEAKTSGRGQCIEYAPEMDASAKEKDQLQSQLTQALNDAGVLQKGDAIQLERALMPRNFGIEVHYQTIHRAGRESEICGAEALVRWRHPTLGLLSPDKFVPVAEDSGLINQLGRLVLIQACAAALTWPSQVKLAVNVSPSQLRNADFVDEVLTILAQTGLPPERLELEVTETALMDGDELTVKQALHQLRRAGIKIALDDFGTGYSSLSHLIQFGIDRLKIDRSFVQLLGTRSDGAAIVSAVVALSHSLGLATTAEGVETTGQRDFLVAAGCTDLQGYLFARPARNPMFTMGSNHDREPLAAT